VAAQINYDIALWEPIRFRVQHATSTLVEDINKEISKNLSLREFWGEYPVPWQLRDVVQQRAESWLERLYALSRDAYVSYGREVSVEFDRAMWAYHVEPFIMREAVNEYGYQASVLFELLLCAVGSPPGNRNDLKVGQKECCLQIRSRIRETWYDKLHHLPARVSEGVAAMARHQANELRAARIVAGLPAEAPAKSAQERKPSESHEQVVGEQIVGSTNALISNPQCQDVPGESEKASRVPQPEALDAEPPVAGVGWRDIEISFVSDERVQIRIGTSTETRNYAEFGFQDRRNGNPSRAWQTLRRLAELRGTIGNAADAGEPWPKVEKRVQEIRKVLREHFDISSDPLPFVESTGYNALFKIGCGPSYRT
jgi:hypothetical protein